MIRRNFMTRLATGGAAAVGTMAAADSKTVTYRIKGFTCITCAVGLDTLLRQQEGIVDSKSSYPDATTTIKFKPSIISESSLQRFIAEMGFVAK